MVFVMEPVVVGASSATQSGLAVAMGAGAAGGAPALLGVTHLGGDLDSLAFAEALRAASAAYLSVAGEHTVQRGLFAQAQSAAAVTAVAGEALRAAAAALQA